jgi:uncharacterized protein YjbJ (UPF0337 family)
MNWNRVEGNWKQIKGKVKEQWGKLTDDDLNVIDGGAISLRERSRSVTGTQKTKQKRVSTTGIMPSGGNNRKCQSPESGAEPLFFCTRCM